MRVRVRVRVRVSDEFNLGFPSFVAHPVTPTPVPRTSDLQVGILNTLGGAMGWLGIWAYDTIFFNDAWPWL